MLKLPTRLCSPARLQKSDGVSGSFADMKELNPYLELQADGSLQPCYLKMENEADAANDPAWAHRLKTWERLKKCGQFAEVSRRSGISLDDLDYAARYGDYQWVGGADGDENIGCSSLDWVAIATQLMSCGENEEAGEAGKGEGRGAR